MTTLIPKFDLKNGGSTPTGAVNRAINLKLGEQVSILDFGADPTGVVDSTSAIQAAHNAYTYVLYPAGTYKITSSIVLPSGSFIIGQGAKSASAGTSNTIINASTSDFVYTMDSPVGTTIEGPRFSNIQINCQNGIRLNSSTGGQPGIAGATQGFINDASFRKVFINQNGTVGTGTGIQASVAFHLEITEQSEVLGFSKNIDVYYSDFVLISHCRLWQFGNCNIQLTAANTFGSHSVIEYNDLLAGSTGSTAFIIAKDYNPSIKNNYIEQTVGEGTGLTAAIVCQSNQQIYIKDNYISIPIGCAPNWLNVSSTASLWNTQITGNTLNNGSIVPATFNSGSGLQTFFNSGNGVTVCNHSGNTYENGIPLNTINRSVLPNSSYKTLSILTPNFYGAITNRDYGLNSYILNDAAVLPPSVGGNQMWFIDPDNKLTQNVAVYILAYATGSQTISTAVFDNYTSGSGYTSITLTTKPTWYQITASYTASTELEVFIYNATGGGSNTAYIQTIVISAP